MAEITPDQARDLDIARVLIEYGVPVFRARPAKAKDGSWDPAGGHNGCGYWIPTGWEKKKPDLSVTDKWQPGEALCALMGHVLDLVDVDPRNGWDPASLDGAMPWPYLVASTPSAGHHAFVKTMGVRSRDNVLPGLDVKAGINGDGHGFAFLAPTLKLSKETGEIRPYEWTMLTDVFHLDAEARNGAAMVNDEDRSGEKLAEMVRAAHGSSGKSSGPFASPDDVKPSPLDDIGQVVAENTRHNAVHKLASALRGQGGWQLREALTFLRAVVYPKLDQAKGGHPYTVEEFETDVRNVFTQYPDGAEARGTSPAITTVDGEDADPFDGAGEGFNDGMLCATVARDVLAGRYRWCKGLGWLSWTGSHWSSTPDQAVLEETRRYLLAQWRAALKRLEQAKSENARKAAEGLVTLWRNTLNKGRIGAITSLAQGIVGILTDPGQLDQHPDLLNVGNGVVDLRTGKLRDHDPELLLTKLTPVDYQPGAQHPDWQAAVEAVPVDVHEWMQVRYGQGITGHMTPDDVMVVQDGGGENGKTTLAQGIRGALGDYYVQISHRALLGDPSQHPTELMSFRGARVALLEELPEERRLSVTRLKSLVGTPTMKARLIRQDEVEFDASHSLFLNTNHLPVVDETDHGTWRRLARLRFPYVFRKPTESLNGPNERRGDPNLRQRIQEGRQGQHEAVLAWLTDGAVAWYKADRIMPSMPARVAADTKEWRGRSDLLLVYAADRLIFDLVTHVMSTELLDDFNAWLGAHGHKAWSDRTLSARLEEHAEFTAHDVEKKYIRPNENLSRRRATLNDPPGRYQAWLGLRFRHPQDDWPDDEGKPDTASDQQKRDDGHGGHATSDNRLENSLARVIQTTVSTVSNPAAEADIPSEVDSQPGGLADMFTNPENYRPCSTCAAPIDSDKHPHRRICDSCAAKIKEGTS